MGAIRSSHRGRQTDYSSHQEILSNWLDWLRNGFCPKSPVICQEPCMSPSEPPKKPMPSVAEINAYLEKSAARTRKRLPLAMGMPAPAPLASLPTTKLPTKKLPTTKASSKLNVQAKPTAQQASDLSSDGSTKWQPYAASETDGDKPNENS